MYHFRYSIIVTIFCLGLAAWWGYSQGGVSGILPALSIAIILGIMEVSLSFDNAVVNASVLKEMDAKWRQIFLTVGILIAVFGMRLVFPIVIVAVAAGQGVIEVSKMAINQPDVYSEHLHSSHTAIAAFGGTFLFMVFLSFLFDEGKELHWLGLIEEKLGQLGKIESIEIIIALLVLWSLQNYLPLTPEDKMTLLLSGLGGLILFVIVDSLSSFFETKEEGEAIVEAVKRNGLMGFIYLEILDASFSFDGVIGAFAITRDVVIIMLGLAIGAMFIRSMTVYLVNKGTLDEYVYLEHGAHYAIGILALIMFYSIHEQVPELFTGLVGVGFIVAAMISSLIYKNKHQAISN
ncbi:DUF475 domain-containing protein [Nitrosomonas communis]|uniref:DUF475 domain-containing protein n=1 Tax=Nitrosomonas communis TaxID=44574 RepID=UPI0026EB3B97|nr:DUF475 domain-containing protein [Nitrosomonas communis]MCO6427621.1 DUF475 domain-containing protein [Nitrosomonas communis]